MQETNILENALNNQVAFSYGALRWRFAYPIRSGLQDICEHDNFEIGCQETLAINGPYGLCLCHFVLYIFTSITNNNNNFLVVLVVVVVVVVVVFAFSAYE
jgi:hypothetical protein